MRTRCGSAFTVLALVVSLGAPAGCIDDGALYWSGELPGSGELPAGTSECHAELIETPSSGAGDLRSATPAVLGAHARAQRGGSGAGFTTSNCESAVTE